MFVSPQIFFNITYGAILISPMMGGEYTAVVALVGYMNFVTIAKSRSFDVVAKICFIGFVISLLASLILLFVHWEAILTERGRPQQTIINVGWFGIAFMIVDAVRFQIAHYKFSIINFARFALILMLVSLLLKIGWIYLAGDGIEMANFFQIVNREIQLVDLNPNHADNVVIFQIALICWIVLTLAEYKDVKLKNLIIAATVCSYMVFLLIVVNSRAAFLGIFFAFMVAVIMNIKRMSLVGILLILCGLISIVIFVPEAVKSRIEIGSIQLHRIFNQLQIEPRNTILTRQQDAELRSEIIEILSNDGATKSTAQRILELCYNGDFAGGLTDKYKIDPSISYRLFLTLDGYNLWKEHPYFGHGKYDKIALIKNYSAVDACRIGYFSHLHNHYSDLTVRGGIFVVSIFLILSGLLFYLLLVDRSECNKRNSFRYLPVLMYFSYLYFENFFDISFHRYAPLSAILFSLSVILSINLKCLIHKNQ